MKKKYLPLLLFLSINLFAQIPQGFNYQATVRNSSDNLLINQNVNFKFNILQNSPTGILVYSEILNAKTDNLGSVDLVVGRGNPLTGAFASINWSNGNYYLGIELDTGSGYIPMGITQLLSVPYAFYAGNSGGTANPSGFEHYLGELYNGGIIFELYRGSDSLEHGLIVALNENTEVISWQNIPVLVNANRSEDGAYNTSKMTDSPAKNYITTLGTGWYLPSIDELGKLFHNRLYVDRALATGGRMPLRDSGYMSSTEYETNGYSIFFFNFMNGRVWTEAKISPLRVRGIRAF